MRALLSPWLLFAIVTTGATGWSLYAAMMYPHLVYMFIFTAIFAATSLVGMSEARREIRERRDRYRKL